LENLTMKTLSGLLLVAAVASAARAELPLARHSHHGRRQPDKYCVGAPEKKTIKKETWEVEREEICIPRLTFPWQACRGPKCGRVISVKKLKRSEYECETRGYKWTIHEKPGCPQLPSVETVPASEAAPSASRAWWWPWSSFTR
jgi:hypothetical protein